jgi:hypothetical protein
MKKHLSSRGENRKPDINPLQMVRQICRQVIGELDAKGVRGINAMMVAERVCKKLDQSRKAPAALFFTAIEGAAQIARPILRGHHGIPDIEAATKQQIEAFGTRLNVRYSVIIGDSKEPEYVFREDIPKDIVRVQLYTMLDRGIRAYTKHKELMVEWNESRPD